MSSLRHPPPPPSIPTRLSPIRNIIPLKGVYVYNLTSKAERKRNETIRRRCFPSALPPIATTPTLHVVAACRARTHKRALARFIVRSHLHIPLKDS